MTTENLTQSLAKTRFFSLLIWLGVLFFPAVYSVWRLGIFQAGWMVPAVHDGDGLMMLQWIDALSRGYGFLGDPRLGYPGVQDLSSFPRADWLHLGALWVLVKMGSPAVLAYNLYLVLGFCLCSVSSTLFWRLWGCPLPRAAVLGILFALLPGHFQQVHHLFLAGYFLIPWQVAPGIRLARGEGTGRWFPSWDEALFAILGGLAGLYYAWFAAFVVAIAGFRAAWLTWSPKPISQIAALSILAFLAAGTGWLPVWLAQDGAGKNAAVGARMALEAETYSLQPLALVLPPQGHLSGLGLFRAEYMGPHRALHEAEAGYLGITAGAGLAAALVALILAGRQTPLEALGLLALVALAYGVTGGLGGLVAWAVPGIRVLGRMSFVLAFVGLSAWGFMPAGRLAGWKGNLGLLLWLLIALADQNIKPEGASPTKRMADWTSMAELGKDIHTAYPSGGKHFQIPWLGYPEGNPPGTMDGYAHLAGVLHAPTQTFSGGGMMNTPADAWQRWVASLPPGEMVAVLKEAGFDGLWVDRRGYTPQKFGPLEKELSQFLGAAVGPKSDRVWFDLKNARNLPSPPPPVPLLVLEKGLLLSPLEVPTKIALRMRGSGSVRILNPGPQKRFRMLLKAEEGATLPGGLVLDGPVGKDLPFGTDHKLETALEFELPEKGDVVQNFKTAKRWLRPAPMPLHDAAIWLEIQPLP